MPAQKRFKTDYPGVYYILGKAVSTGKPEKIFYIDYRKNGKRVQEKAGRQYQDNMTPAKANQIRANKIQGRELPNAERRAAQEAAEKAENDRWTIDRLWDLYCENNADNKSLKNEKLKYENAIRNRIGKKEPGELVPLDIDRIRIKWIKAGKKTMGVRVLELLRRTVNYGVNRGLVAPINYKIEIPRLNNQTTEDLSPEQIKKLIEVLDADNDQTAANVMRLALFTGMRRGEIFKLRWDDIDFRRGFITLADPKGGQDQTIPLNDAARAVLESIETDDDEPWVFPGRFPGQHLTDCRDSFRRIAKAAGFPPGFRPLHGLRHVYASMLASSGQVDLYTLQKLMTHKSPLMTQRYAHLRDEALKAASNLAGDIVASITTDNGKKVAGIDDRD
ncbi:Site-specific recombinase XerD [Desulfosarcina cetonica]|uniref:tyrosine-type recombinase/integrase n=1 Tax=Desulfosarcina cetonica TaxID=90730 RepID=UPI0006D0DB5F|nr:site-specific integrase [Desulfosarcina cetonica]VTR66769.1 Site-specific recombinase XerD [Desulfosarcina cetonica]